MARARNDRARDHHLLEACAMRYRQRLYVLDGRLKSGHVDAGGENCPAHVAAGFAHIGVALPLEDG